MDDKATQPGTPSNIAVETGFSGEKLLSVLQALAKTHDLPFSRERALHGLPLTNDELTLDLFVRSASRIGLDAKVVAMRPSQVSAIVFPFVLFFNNGDVGIALEKRENGQSISVMIDGVPGIRKMRPSEMDHDCTNTVIYAAVKDLDAVGNREKVLNTLQSGHWFWSKFIQFWPTWIYIVFAALIINLLGLALPLFVMNVYDRVIPNNSISTLWALVVGVAIALVFDFVLRVIRSKLIDSSSRRVDMSVSSDLFEHALDAKMATRGSHAGELANQIREFESVRDFFTSTGLTSLIDLLFIGVFLGLLWLIVGPLALVALFAVPCVLLVTLLLQIPLAKSVRKTQATSANRHSILIESLVSIETVKAISIEGAMQKRWESAVAGSVRASSATHFWSSLAMYFTMFAQQAVSVIIIVWGVFLVAAGDITIGALIASNILAGRVLAPLGSIAMTAVRAQQSFNAFGMLNRLMKLERDHQPAFNAKAKVDKGGIEFRELEFAYDKSGENVLDEISLRITPGERVGIVGRVGSGKSTMGKLLCGLYQADNGAIIIDDTDTRHYSIADLRKAVGYVGQETELFSGSLKDNLTLSGPKPTDVVLECASVSGVAAFAQTHPLGYEMPVGERGKDMSGGQRQSVGIARAMLANHKILFLDEPTGQMDNLTEAAFIRGFKPWLDPATTLLVSTHRMALLDLVDRLIILDKGKIIADGPKGKVLQSIGKTNLVQAKKGK